MLFHDTADDRMVSTSVGKNSAEFISDTADIRLAFFVDGSFGDKSSNSGVGVVFTRFRPGSWEHGRQIEMAFPLLDSRALDNNVVEAIGILQAILVAIKELEDAGPLETNLATVAIFSDSLEVLNFVNWGVFYKQVEDDIHHRAMNLVMARIIAAARRLIICRGMVVLLELWWIKGHENVVYQQKLADLVANEARSLEQQEAWIDDADEVPCRPANAFDHLQAELAALLPTPPVLPVDPVVPVCLDLPARTDTVAAFGLPAYPNLSARLVPVVAPVAVVAPIAVVVPPAVVSPVLLEHPSLPPRPASAPSQGW